MWMVFSKHTVPAPRPMPRIWRNGLLAIALARSNVPPMALIQLIGWQRSTHKITLRLIAPESSQLIPRRLIFDSFGNDE